MSLALVAILVAAPTAEPAPAAPIPKRVVAIGGAVTETVYALGEGARLVGRDSTSVYPPEALKLPDVGYMRALSPEGVLSMDPDLILVIEGSGPPEALAVLRDAGVALVEIPDAPYDGSGIRAKILAVGRALGREAKASALAASVTADIERASRAAAAKGPPRRVMFVLSARGGRILAAGKDTAADGIIRLAGGTNVFEFSGYKPVSAEALLERDPEVIVQMSGGRHGPEGETGRDALFSMPAVQQTTAGRNGASVRVDGPRALGFGPRTAEAITHLSALLASPPSREGGAKQPAAPSSR